MTKQELETFACPICNQTTGAIPGAKGLWCRGERGQHRLTLMVQVNEPVTDVTGRKGGEKK